MFLVHHRDAENTVYKPMIGFPFFSLHSAILPADKS